MIKNGTSEVLAVYLGETQISAIYKGSDVVFAPNVVTYSVTTNLTNITSDAPSLVVEDSSLQVTLTVNTGHYLDDSSVVVTMGGVDITSTAYSNGVVTIAVVTGDVSITADTVYDAEVEYLQGDGAAYINTDVIGCSTSMINIDFTILSGWSGGSAIFGARTSNSANMFTLQFYRDATGSGSNFWRWAFGTKTAEGTHNKTVGTFNAKDTGYARIMEISGDHTFTLTCANQEAFTSNLPIFLFCMNSGGGPSNRDRNAYLRIIRVMIYVRGTRVRYMYPVRKNGVGYLYDSINGVLYGNANSTGAFTYGNDKTT